MKIDNAVYSLYNYLMSTTQQNQDIKYVPIDEEPELSKRFIKLTVLVPEDQLPAADHQVVTIYEHTLLDRGFKVPALLS